MSGKAQFEADAPPGEVDAHLVEALSRNHRAALIRYFEKRGVAGADAEDAAQEVLFRLARRGRLAEIERLEGFLFQTAANLAVDLHRFGGQRLTSRHISYDERVHGESQDLTPGDILESREALAMVLTALKELPERTRNAFLMARFENLRHAEIARRLGVSTSAVEKHINRAMSYLVGRLEGQP